MQERDRAPWEAQEGCGGLPFRPGRQSVSLRGTGIRLVDLRATRAGFDFFYLIFLRQVSNSPLCLVTSGMVLENLFALHIVFVHLRRFVEMINLYLKDTYKRYLALGL